MIFKRKETAETEVAEIESSLDLDMKYQQMLRKQQRGRRIKETIIFVIILLVSIGGLKSLFTAEKDIAYERAINHYAFAEEYVENYFKYPQSKENDTFLQLFTINNASRSEYDLNKVKNAEITDVDIYHVNERDSNIKDYYMNADLEVTSADNKKTKQRLSVKLTAANVGDAFAVTEPIQMKYIQTQGMDDEIKADFEKSNDTEGNDCSEEESKELQNTIQLFLKTYVSDYEQARLLMNDADMLDPVDANTTISPESFQSIRKTETEFIIDVSVVIVTNKTITQRQDYRFIVDQKTNKIMKMEEY